MGQELYTFSELKEMLKNKELEVNTDIDREKIEVIKELFQDEGIFFKVDFDTALGILNFLGIPENKIKNVYYKLISGEEYLKTSKPYIIIPDGARK